MPVAKGIPTLALYALADYGTKTTIKQFKNQKHEILSQSSKAP